MRLRKYRLFSELSFTLLFAAASFWISLGAEAWASRVPTGPTQVLTGEIRHRVSHSASAAHARKHLILVGKAASTDESAPVQSWELLPLAPTTGLRAGDHVRVQGRFARQQSGFYVTKVLAQQRQGEQAAAHSAESLAVLVHSAGSKMLAPLPQSLGSNPLGPVMVSVEGSQCAPDEIARQALPQLSEQGITLADYRRHIFLLPSDLACPWESLADTACADGQACQAWIKASPRLEALVADATAQANACGQEPLLSFEKGVTRMGSGASTENRVHIVNRNPAGCGALDFTLSVATTAGLHATMAANSLRVEAASRGAVAFTISSKEANALETVTLKAAQMANGQVLRAYTLQAHAYVGPKLAYYPGVEAKYFQGDWNVLPAFETLTPLAEKVVEKIGLNESPIFDSFGIDAEAYLKIGTEGVYDFFLTSDDGSRLFINGLEVIDNDGLHSTLERTGQAYLFSGYYPVRVKFFEKGGGQTLSLAYQTAGMSKREVPAKVLFRANRAPTVNAGPDITLSLPQNTTKLSGECRDCEGECWGMNWTVVKRGASEPADVVRVLQTNSDLYLNNLAEGIYDVTLTGFDEIGAYRQDTVVVTVNPAAR